MKCLVIDDEATARMIIQQLIDNNPQVEKEEEFPNALQAIKYLNHNSADLIFLDIHMPDFTGFDFIQTLKNPPNVILTTSDKSFGIEAFEYDCIVDYLVKPITQDRFDKAVAKALNSNSKPTTKEVSSALTKSENDLYVNIDRRLIKIDIPSIYLIEAKGDYIQIKTSDKNYIVHSTLKKIEEKLPDDIFLKVHRSFIINT
ncbi:MAG: LytTR family DNA-binding domain-containing protein, partial [Gramella sp.]|nr:LytTR family DNA-binding domain-containing protein [Christiangramia sp.]